MKNILILFAGIVLLASCATQSKTILEKAKEIPITKTTDDWYLFEYDAQNYSIQFPKAPAPQHEMIDSEVGKLDMRLFVSEISGADDEQVLYGIAAIDYPLGIIHSSRTELNQFYKGSVNGAVNNLGGTLIAEEKIELDGFEGRAIKIDIQDGAMLVNMRMYLIGNRMYTLQTMHEFDKDKSFYTKRFFNSFRVDEMYKEAASQQTVTNETDAGWRLYESKNGAYKITFPKIPLENSNPISTKTGPLNLYSVTCQGNDFNTAYMSAYVDYPDSLVNSKTTNLEEFYNNVINSSAANAGGKILDVRNIQLNNIEGREAKMIIESEGVSILSTMRLFLVINRMYMIQIVAEKDVEIPTKRFMDSFELIE